MDEITLPIDKLEIASTRLGDTICGYFGGDHPITTIANAKAVAGLLRDIQGHFYPQGFRPPKMANGERQRVQAAGDFNRHLRDISNFSKHADNGSTVSEVLVKGWYAELALNATCIDYANITDDLVGQGFAHVDDCLFYDTPLGQGTRTYLLIDLFGEFMKQYESRLHRNKTQPMQTRKPLSELFTDEDKQSVYDLIVKSGLRKADAEMGDIKLVKPAGNAVLEFDIP